LFLYDCKVASIPQASDRRKQENSRKTSPPGRRF